MLPSSFSIYVTPSPPLSPLYPPVPPAAAARRPLPRHTRNPLKPAWPRAVWRILHSFLFLLLEYLGLLSTFSRSDFLPARNIFQQSGLCVSSCRLAAAGLAPSCLAESLLLWLWWKHLHTAAHTLRGAIHTFLQKRSKHM